jgi:large subunit ribosomal protein L13
MPLGRMAEMIAVFIRGKHKPEYSNNRFDLGDKCIVVNASKVKVTVKKRIHKLYRHHTGFAGGLKEIPFKDLLAKDPGEIIRRAVKGMLPNNNIQGTLLERNLIVHADLYHNHFA